MVIYKGENVLFIGSLSGFGGLCGWISSHLSKSCRDGVTCITSGAGDHRPSTPQGRCSWRLLQSRGPGATHHCDGVPGVCRRSLGRHCWGLFVYLWVYERGHLGTTPTLSQPSSGSLTSTSKLSRVRYPDLSTRDQALTLDFSPPCTDCAGRLYFVLVYFYDFKIITRNRSFCSRAFK